MSVEYERVIDGLTHCALVQAGLISCKWCAYDKPTFRANCKADLMENAAQLLKEQMDDLRTFSSLLVHITGNRMSKTNYTLDEILACMREIGWRRDIDNGCDGEHCANNAQEESV